MFDPFDGQAEDFVPRLVQFELAVDLGGGQEDVDAAAFAGGLDGLAGRVDVPRHATRQAADDGAFDLTGDGLDGCEIAVADDREAGLDDIDLQARQLPGDLQLFAQVHGSARALLAVAKGGVKDGYAIIFHIFGGVM